MTEAQDRDDFNIHKQAKDMYITLHDISQELRKLYKYEDLSEKTADELVDQIRQFFFDCLGDNNVDLDI